jgi:hypothetical protein
MNVLHMVEGHAEALHFRETLDDLCHIWEVADHTELHVHHADVSVSSAWLVSPIVQYQFDFAVGRYKSVDRAAIIRSRQRNV